MSKTFLIILVALLALTNVVLINAQMRKSYDLENKVRTPPKVHVFQTQYNGGTQIVFNHEEHAEDMGLECIECHHVESCDHCHGESIGQMEVEEAKVALHKNCMSCHNTMDVGPQECDECHRQ